MPDADNPKAGITAIFDQIAGGYDNPSQRFFPFAADYMLNLAQPVSGNRVLDIATGTGMAAIAAARMIQPGGRVQASENDGWEIINNNAMRGLLNLLDDAQQDSLRAEHLQRVAGLKSNDGIWLDVEVIFSEGSKPL